LLLFLAPFVATWGGMSTIVDKSVRILTSFLLASPELVPSNFAEFNFYEVG